MFKNKITDLTKKVDLNSLVKGVTSMINPTGATPDADDNDALGVKLAQVSTLVQSVANIQAEQTKAFAKINKLVNELYADIEVVRAQVNDIAKAKAELAGAAAPTAKKSAAKKVA